jgi:hypothetical protein
MMVAIKSQDALKKVCPFSMGPQSCFCVASRCMAWKATKMIRFISGEAVEEDLGEGCCGLISKRNNDLSGMSPE